MQGNTKIIKTDSGRLAYNGTNEKPTEITYNTLSTPKGGQYQLILPDGSKVWLNAASSIRYPTAFVGNSRIVEITGEAYFEVMHNSKVPFEVKTRSQVIEDIGTSFNVNAYTDEAAIRTTLLEGAVKVDNVVLKPGEQAEADNGTQKITVIKGVDIQRAVAWKNGIFSFKDADLKTVMRQLARWYNVDVEYEGAVPGGSFGGDIGRGLTLSQVLEGLAETRVKYKITEGNKIIIQP
jgi:ferric-dicitrate binding protein FerR (iron transport regulator)